MSQEELWVPEQLLSGQTANLCENQGTYGGGEGNTQYHFLPCVSGAQGQQWDLSCLHKLFYKANCSYFIFYCLF